MEEYNETTSKNEEHFFFDISSTSNSMFATTEHHHETHADSDIVIKNEIIQDENTKTNELLQLLGTWQQEYLLDHLTGNHKNF